MNFRVINREEAPRFAPYRSKEIRDRQAQYEGFLHELPRGMVGELELLDGEEPRKVKVNLTRAASRVGMKIQSWGHDAVYFKVVR